MVLTECYYEGKTAEREEEREKEPFLQFRTKGETQKREKIQDTGRQMLRTYEAHIQI